MSDQKLNYKQAIQRIESLVSKIEGEDPEVDHLSEMVKEALDLLKFCKEHLKKTEDDLNEALQGLE